MNRSFLLILLFVFTVFVTANTQKYINSDDRSYHETILPNDTTLLWIGTGDISKDTVFIVGEGGPKHFLDFESNGRLYWEYLENIDNYYCAVVHQSNTYKRSIFNTINFTIADAQKEVDHTTEFLHRTIKYFKEKGKYVVVFGQSYGAWVIQHYLSKHQSIADKYIITSCRLDADSTQTAFQKKGINIGWKEDGQTLIIPDKNEEPNPYRTMRYWEIRKVKDYIKYASGRPRFTNKLANVDLSNVHYFYGKYDQNVGALTQHEIEFLKSRGAQVEGFDTNHYGVWKRVIDKFREGTLRL